MLVHLSILWLSLYPYPQSTSYTLKTTDPMKVIQPSPNHVKECVSNSKEPLIGGRNLQGKIICKF